MVTRTSHALSSMRTTCPLELGCYAIPLAKASGKGQFHIKASVEANRYVQNYRRYSATKGG